MTLVYSSVFVSLQAMCRAMYVYVFSAWYYNDTCNLYNTIH